MKRSDQPRCLPCSNSTGSLQLCGFVSPRNALPYIHHTTLLLYTTHAIYHRDEQASLRPLERISDFYFYFQQERFQQGMTQMQASSTQTEHQQQVKARQLAAPALSILHVDTITPNSLAPARFYATPSWCRRLHLRPQDLFPHLAALQ